MTGTENRKDVDEAAERASLLLQVDQLREQEPRILNEIEKVSEQLETAIQNAETPNIATHEPGSSAEDDPVQPTNAPPSQADSG